MLHIYALATLLPLVILLFRRSIYALLTPRGYAGIPAYNDSKPIWGDLHRLKEAAQTGKGVSTAFDNALQDLGPISQLRIGFFKTFILLGDYQSVEYLLTRQTKTIDRSTLTTGAFKGLIPTGQISLLTGEMWKRHRRFMGPAMTSKYLALATPAMSSAIEEMIDMLRLRAKLAGDRPFEIQKDFEAGTMDLICAVAFGSHWGISASYAEQAKQLDKIPSGELGDAVFPQKQMPLPEAMVYLFNSVNNRSAYPLLSHLSNKISPTWRKHARRLEVYLTDRAHEARARAKEMGAEVAVETATSTLDMIVARELREGTVLSDTEMKDELYLYLVAGTETSATTLSWMVKYLTANPTFQHKLRDSILRAVPELADRLPNFDDVNPAIVPLIEAVIHETLRIARVASAFAREVYEDTMVLGNMIPKGAIVIMPTLTGMEDETTPVYRTEYPSAVETSKALESKRDPQAVRKPGFWAANTAQQFMPERWLDSEGKFDPNAGPSMPFSLGQRGCFGKALALLELRLFVCQLSLGFFFAPVEEKMNSFDSIETIATHPKQAYIRPVPWESAEAQRGLKGWTHGK